MSDRISLYNKTLKVAKSAEIDIKLGSYKNVYVYISSTVISKHFIIVCRNIIMIVTAFEIVV